MVLSITLISYLSFYLVSFLARRRTLAIFSGDYTTTLGTPISQFLIGVVQKYGNGVDALPSLHAGITAILCIICISTIGDFFGGRYRF